MFRVFWCPKNMNYARSLVNSHNSAFYLESKDSVLASTSRSISLISVNLSLSSVGRCSITKIINTWILWLYINFFYNEQYFVHCMITVIDQMLSSGLNTLFSLIPFVWFVVVFFIVYNKLNVCTRNISKTADWPLAGIQIRQ